MNTLESFIKVHLHLTKKRNKTTYLRPSWESYGIVNNPNSTTGFCANLWKLIVRAIRFTRGFFFLGSIVGTGNS